MADSKTVLSLKKCVKKICEEKGIIKLSVLVSFYYIPNEIIMKELYVKLHFREHWIWTYRTYSDFHCRLFSQKFLLNDTAKSSLKCLKSNYRGFFVGVFCFVLRERMCVEEGQREKERENLKQAPCSALSLLLDQISLS